MLSVDIIIMAPWFEVQWQLCETTVDAVYESTYGFGQAHFQNVALVCKRLQTHESLKVHPKRPCSFN